MKKLLILLNHPQNVPFIDFLKRQLGEEFIKVGYFNQLIITVEMGKIRVWLEKENLSDYDLVYFRRSGKYTNFTKALAYYCEKSKIDYMNRAYSQNLVSDKIGDMVRLAFAGLPVAPSTVCIPQNLPDGYDYPLIVKTPDDHGGFGVNLIKNKESLNSLPSEIKIFQKYYSNDGDFRILVADGRVIIAEKRIRQQDEYRNTAGLGGKEVFYQLDKFPEKLKRLSIQAAEVLDLQIAGVDILIDQETSKEWILEVNPKPTFTSDLNISPELPEVAKYFADKLGKKSGH